MNISKFVAVVAITLLFTANVQADAIRCGSHVIEDGELENAPTMQEVLKKCGQPSSREGSSLYYKKKGKRLDFDTEGRLLSINDIEEE